MTGADVPGEKLGPILTGQALVRTFALEAVSSAVTASVANYSLPLSARQAYRVSKGKPIWACVTFVCAGTGRTGLTALKTSVCLLIEEVASCALTLAIK